MTKNTKRKGLNLGVVILGVFISASFIFYLFEENYIKCLAKNLSMCVASKKYVSKNGAFSLRYPADYPLTAKDGEQLIKDHGLNDVYDEMVNFSIIFDIDGDRNSLGNITVLKKSPYKTVKEYGESVARNSVLSERRSGIYPIVEYITIDEEKAAKITPSKQLGILYPQHHQYVIIRDNKLYDISFNYNRSYHKLPAKHYDEGEDLITSTFTFL